MSQSGVAPGVPSPAAPGLRRRAGSLLALLAALLAAGSYANTLHSPFVFDDRTEIVENPSIRSLSDPAGIVRHSITRPVTNLSYALDYAAWGEDPFGFHLTNVALHVANVLILFALAAGLGRELAPARSPVTTALGAFAAAGLLAAHPLMTEAVGYVSGRAEVLCATLFLGSLWFFRRAFASPARPVTAAVLPGGLLFLLALATKESAAMLPAVLLLYDVLRPRPPGSGWRARLWTVHAPLLLGILALGAARIWLYTTVEHATSGGDPRNLLVNLHVAERYLSLLALPVSQSVVHTVFPFASVADPRLVTAALVVGGVFAAAVALWRRQPLVTFGIGWFFLLLMPSMALILLADRGQPMAEHRVYLASCGVFLVCAAVVVHVLREEPDAASARWRGAAALVAAALIALAALTVSRNALWADPVELWVDAARKAPRTWAANYAAAEALREADRCEEALTFHERAVVLRPGHAETYLGLAACHETLRRPERSRLVLQAAVKQVPGDPRLPLTLGLLEERSFSRPEEALRMCEEALRRAPGLAEAMSCVRRNAPVRPGS